jgi:pimeloyl-ACP methyl ester carboxylesterase
MAAEVREVLRDLAIARPVLIGHSLGALICNAIAAQAPDAARAVVNVDQSLRLSGFAAALRSLWPHLHADFQSTVVPIFDAMLPPGLSEEIRAALQEDYRRMNPQVTMDLWSPLVALEADAVESMIASTLSGIQVPYLALHGSNPGADYVPWLQQRLPTAEVELWEDTLHFPHLVYPERFVARVMAFAAA